MRQLIETVEGVPFQTVFLNSELVKAKDEAGKWILYLEASNESVDSDGEITVMSALKKAAKDYLLHGVISWDHLHRVKGDPEAIIGEPLDVSFSELNKSTLIKGMLYQQNKKAIAIWNNIQSGTTRLGSSIGGFILSKAENQIRDVIWRDVAVTDKPVLASTQGKVSLMPFPEFAKALMAGSGVNAAEFTGGRAITPENMQGVIVDQTLLGNIFLQFLKLTIERRINSYEEVISFLNTFNLSESVARQILDFIYNKLENKTY